MAASVKEIVPRRKSIRTLNGKALRSEDRQKLDELDDPGFAADDSTEYFVTYEVRHRWITSFLLQFIR